MFICGDKGKFEDFQEKESCILNKILKTIPILPGDIGEQKQKPQFKGGSIKTLSDTNWHKKRSETTARTHPRHQVTNTHYNT